MSSQEVSLIEFRQIKQWLVKEIGIEIDDSKRYLIAGRLEKILSDSRYNSYTELFNQIRLPQNRQIKETVVNAMTTNETYWFRDDRPFKMFKEHILSELIPKLESGLIPRIKIWSAACSSGQEPYSLAILIHKALLHKPELLKKVEILATDLDTDKVKEAQTALYSSFSMSRGMPEDLKMRYFKLQGSQYLLNPDIQNMVQFKPANLSQSFAWVGKCEVIFMRNVLIYFPDEVKGRIFRNIKQLMTPQSYFVIGSSETLEPFSDLLNYQDTPLGRYYKL